MSSPFSEISTPGEAPGEAFTVVSTFSGCGGSSKGYEMAGSKVRLAVEWDDHAVECYRLNFPETPIYHGDVAALSVEEACALADVEPGELDLFDGSPPCQGFSTSGKREIDDPRNTLFKEYVRLLNGLRPRTFVMENVSGMVKGKMKLVFAQVLRELRRCGYVVSARLMNAKWYGVPQARERLIFIGVREDLAGEPLGFGPSHPTGWGPPITCREALEGLPEDAERTLGDLGYWIWSRAKPYERWSKHHPRGHWFNSVTIDPDRPAPTIPKTNGTKGGGSTVAHWQYPRCLNIAEVKRLFSFPDDFELTGSHSAQWARLGNSVPPKLTAAVAGHILQTVLEPAREAAEAA